MTHDDRKAAEINDRLSREQSKRLSDIEDTRRWAWDARQDAAHERQLVAARYFVLGATGYDIEDDELLRKVMALAYGDAGR